jgi:hypothetical protein
MKIKPLLPDEIPQDLRGFLNFDDQSVPDGSTFLHINVRCPECKIWRSVMVGSIRHKIKQQREWTARCKPCENTRRGLTKRRLQPEDFTPEVLQCLDLDTIKYVDGKPRLRGACFDCGRELWLSTSCLRSRKTPPRCLSCAKKSSWEARKNNEWGKTKNAQGYISIKFTAVPEQFRELIAPMVNPRGYILEHRLVMAIHLQRALDLGEVVHHRDGKRDHNTIDNLQLFITVHHPGHGDYYQDWQEALTKIRELERRIKSPA